MMPIGNTVAAAPRLAALSLACVLAACSSMSERQQDTTKGAAIGAVAGGVLGAATKNNVGQSAVAGGVLGAVAGNLWSRHMEEKRAALAKASAGTGIEVGRTANNQLKLDVPSDFSFDVGRADIKPRMRPVLDEIARNLDPSVHITVVGHTDNTGSDAVNEPLSRQRAQAVRDYLDTHGVTAARVAIEGRGSREPVAENGSDAGRARNRRVEIYLAEKAA